MHPERIRRALEELEGLRVRIAEASSLDDLRPLYYGIEGLAKAHEGQSDVQAAVAKIKGELVARANLLKQGGSPPPPAAAPPPDSKPEPVQPPPSDPPPPPPPSIAWQRAMATGAVLGLVLFAGALSIFTWLRGGSGELYAVEIRTSPPGATILVGDSERGRSDTTVRLAAGEHRVQALLDGFQPAVATVVAGPETPAVHLSLIPLATALRLMTDLDQGKVWLNGGVIGELQDGQFVLPALEPGRHVIRVAGRASEASFTLQVPNGGVPEVDGPVSARNALAVLVAHSQRHARVYGSSAGMLLSLDGREAGVVTVEGTELAGIGPGDHELTFSDGSEMRRVYLSIGPNPALSAFLKLDVNAGTLVVTTGEDDAIVYLNGREYPRRTRDGQIRIPFLDVRDYTVRVEKRGYEPVEGQRATIRKGEETRLAFDLRPLPRVAALKVAGALPGAEVLLDGESIGTVLPDGGFSAVNIPPGERMIELRKAKFRPRRIIKAFRAGDTVELLPTETALEEIPGTVKLTFSPPDARVTIRHAQERQEQIVRETTLSLPEGSYILAATAPGHTPQSFPLQVTSGQSQNINISLAADISTAAAPEARVFGMERWEKPKQWSAEGAWLVHTGGNSVLYRVSPAAGTFTFTVALLKGRRLQWILNYSDDRNYALFQTDKRHLYRKDVVNGKTFDLARVPLGQDRDAYHNLQVEITPEAVVHRVYEKEKWRTLDEWKQPGRDFTKGKFGFLIPQNDQVGLSNFSFTPR